MRNKRFIVISILLLIAVAAAFYLYTKRYEEFKQAIAAFERAELERFNSEKQNKLKLLAEGDQKMFQLYSREFDENKSIEQRDSIFSLFYINSVVNYKIHRLSYINCLHDKYIIDQKNEHTLEDIKRREKDLESRYGETFQYWYPQFKDKKLITRVSAGNDCKLFFPDLQEIIYNEKIWNDFSGFMSAYDSDIKDAAIQNSNFQNNFSSAIVSTKSQLNSNMLDYFENLVHNRRSEILIGQQEQRSYTSSSLGQISYTISRVKFDKNVYEAIAEKAFEEQWKSNSLRTGAMPYAYCYGSSNYCNDYGCSKISVITGGSNDVLVTIKNSKGNVVRHGYIQGGATLTFNVPDGEYQVFFYSGTGWNPGKFMTTTTCGSLRGGFVSAENYTKDSYISLYSKIMTYELILQDNGNFATQPSSKNEAFN